MEPIRGGLRGRSVLRIDPDTGPLVAKRFTAGDFTRLVMTHNLDKHTQLHIILYTRKKDNWKCESCLKMATPTGTQIITTRTNVWLHYASLSAVKILQHIPPTHVCEPASCDSLTTHTCVCACVYTVIWNPSRIGSQDAVIFHHLSFYWFVYKNSQTCCPRALLLPPTLLVCSLGHPELSLSRQKTNHFLQTPVTILTDNTLTTIAIN